VLPLAVPPYVAAYCFTEFLHFTGPVQGAIRVLFGFRSSREYWFPDVRSLPGAILILSLTLYPYVFLTVRAVFLAQGPAIREAAAILGASKAQSLRLVLLPLARPAIATGVALALMEALNDIGAVEALGVRTVTFAVYSTWLNGNDLVGATRLALTSLAAVFALLALERFSRRRLRYAPAGAQDRQGAGAARLRGWRGLAMLGVCLLPALGGFGIPCLVLVDYAARRLDQAGDPALWRALGNTLAIGSGAGCVAVLAGLVTAFALRTGASRALAVFARLGAIGYAVPGTVLAIGVLVPFAAFDNALDAWARSAIGVSTGLLLSGSGAAVVYACAVRFNAMSFGAAEAGLASLSPQLDDAARGLGASGARLLAQILLPLLRPACLTAFLLVAVETAKELSATILLRPFDFDTLATLVYAQASRAAFEEGALAALLIVAVGTLPVALLHRRGGERAVR
jgi:iron(III) transport system permease protein